MGADDLNTDFTGATTIRRPEGRASMADFA